MTRVYNFSAGPAMLPEEVLREAAQEMLDYKGTGMSVMEMSHRSKAFDTIITEAEQDLRDLVGIGDDYEVMFLQGGASQQFAAVPMNMLQTGKADYIVSGNWSKKAYQEACRYGDITLLADSKDANYSCIPAFDTFTPSKDADYLYVCYNETITGTTYRKLPETDAPVVADMSSCFLSEPIDIEKFGVVYAGAQKNVGPAGVVIAIVRKDLIRDDVMPATPTMLKWKTQADAKSLYNTPPCYAIYICGKVFKWIKSIGGLEAMQMRNHEKAVLLYNFLDNSKLFSGTAAKENRSMMNVPFITGDDALDKEFIAAAAKEGLVELKGHRSVGGMRASIYNAMPLEGVQKLVAFMEKFENEHSNK